MQLVFLVIQIILAIAIIGAVLLQKNGGDGLGSLGGGNSMGGNSIVSGRTTASFLSRATAILMAAFMINSLILGNMSVRDHKKTSIIENSIKKEAEPIKQEPQVPVSE